MPGVRPPPPPPARRHRRPFVTLFIADVLPFLSARDVLVCAGVCRVWREEANSLSLWRELLANDPATAMHAYRRRTLHAIQRIALRRASIPGIEENYVGFSSTFNRGRGSNRLEHTLETGSGFISENDFRKNCGARGFSLGLPFLQIVHKEIAERNPEHGAIDLVFKKKAGSTMKAMESLQLQMILLKKHVSKSTHVLDALRQQMPNRDVVLLHEECFRKWKRLKIFEELVVNLLYSSIEGSPPSERVRNFVQAEMVAISRVGSPFYLKWCRFKNVLPLNDGYYDYVDFLYSYGPGMLYTLNFPLIVESEGKKLLDYFSTLQNTINDIIRQKHDESKNISWDCLLQRLGKKTGCL
ncbi:hypothetical protein MOQ_008294 [Trypanosoma cruzi marinkellei]|uniref:F-box domain-containing protein n=1 Tax=Trypanosoma cruzi marinkellei TaxID=85056 RepID=K2LZ60_TRYCR|nr:hypothetical protein MOQ_008294 [Trypanosoma cruzi marinkellei]